MELSRSEFLKKRGRNWGAEQAESTILIESRGGKVESYTTRYSDNVLRALSEFVTHSGDLDLRKHVNRLSNDELWAVLRACERPVTTLNISGWNNMEPKCLRSLSLVVGDDLKNATLGESPLDDLMLETFCSRLYTLKSLSIPDCPNIGNIGIRALTLVAHGTLEALAAPRCPRLGDEALRWLGGQAGFRHPPTAGLRSLDLARCPGVGGEAGLAALGAGCPRLRFLNLSGCAAVTNAGVRRLAGGCRGLRVLNLYGCPGVDDPALKALGKRCRRLRSLNAGRCGQMTDRGVAALGRGCPELQALNVAGSRAVSEASIYELVTNCKGLHTLNITGCEDITVNGLKAMIEGLKFVKAAKAFFGFVPVDEATDKKIVYQQELIEKLSARRIQQAWHDYLARGVARKFKEDLKQLQAIQKIQKFWRNEQQRRKWAAVERGKRRREAARRIQRGHRRARTRRKMEELRRVADAFMARRPQAVAIQALYRGYLTRRHAQELFQALRRMVGRRRAEAEQALAVGAQAGWRRFVARRRNHPAKSAEPWVALLASESGVGIDTSVEATRVIMGRRRRDQLEAARAIQGVARSYIAKVEFARKKAEKIRMDHLHKQAAIRLQAFWRGTQGKFSGLMRKQEIERMIRHRNRKATELQAFYRGHRARTLADALRFEEQLRHDSARAIQAAWRGAQVLGWRDIRTNKVAAFIFRRQELETLQRARDVEERLLLGPQRRKAAGAGAGAFDGESSSGEESAGEEEFWQERTDAEGRTYHYNQMTAEESYLPPDTKAFEKGLIGMNCRIYWPMEQEWFDAEITKWSRKKGQHKIMYDDGDNEYINFEEEYERVQLLVDEVWIPYNMHIPSWRNEHAEARKQFQIRKKKNKKLLKTEEKWLKFWDDDVGKMRWFNEVTGEMKYAVEAADEYVVIEDDAAEIRYEHKATGERLTEDPRFEVDEEALEKARKEQEEREAAELDKVRFALYFVKNLVDAYLQALEESQHAVAKILKKIAAEKDTVKLGAALHHAKEVFPQEAFNNNEELKYAHDVLEYMQELKGHAERDSEAAVNRKKDYLSTFQEKKAYHCQKCQHEVEGKHVKFCPHCNARLVF